MSKGAKFQHLIPRTYLAAWANEAGTVCVEEIKDKQEGKRVNRNISTILREKEYYSILPGMPYCTTQEDTDCLFAPLAEYVVTINSDTVTDTQIMNCHFSDFDSWRICRADGSLASNKQIKDAIIKNKLRDIEQNWSIKYENQWPAVVKDLCDAILSAPSRTIHDIHKAYLTEFQVALDWRAIKSNQSFRDEFTSLLVHLEDSDIPEGQRLLPFLTTTKEFIEHIILLKWYRQFFKKQGPIYEYASSCVQTTSFHFLVADGMDFFVVSDNPAFTCNMHTGEYPGNSKKVVSGDSLVSIMPITPKILMLTGKSPDNCSEYWISHVNSECVAHYNKLIRKHANKWLIYPCNSEMHNISE